DHIADVPYLMRRTPTVRAVCEETTRQLLISMGADPARLIAVSGGEHLDFDGYVVEVVPSLHSRSADWRYFAPGRLIAPPPAPQTISDLVAGETVAYQLSFANGPSIFWSGATDFDERAVEGRRPDIAIISMTATKRVNMYLERLIRALGMPRILIPNHHDDLQTPLGETVIIPEAIAEFREVARRVSPDSTVIEPAHLEVIEL
ncbi:MAG TPA: MBL fold metallo-hydrolase, partial [Acidimicrobiia bacterium]|nr:MBL fold metallo-hydrolase [Acidimicrobiia bacterium]